MTQQSFNKLTWGILLLSIILPMFVWGEFIGWSVGDITIYQWFPLFGLIAWMVMWTHYISGTIRVKNPELKKPKYYEPLTAYLVLVSLLLHPGLLAFALWSNDVGLPPNSFYDYVGDSLKLAVIFGSISLMIFLSFEIFNRTKTNKHIIKWWLAISISQSIAMTLIFVHGLRLGSILSGWFEIVWVVYGLLLIPCFYIIHRQDIENRAKNSTVV